MTTALRPPRDVRAAPEFLPFEHPAWLLPVGRLTPGSACVRHVPFGMYLVDAMRPRVVVQLGSDANDLLAAVGQVAEERGLTTRTAVVDRQAPFDGEIDLLLHDGTGDLETLRQDFALWLPRLSRRGVVLLSGTQAGSGRFWTEVSASQPHFELTDGAGLGVLAVGPDVAPQVRALVEANDATTAHARGFFALLGQRLAFEAELRELRDQLQRQRELMAREQRTFRELGAELLAQHHARAQLAAQLAELKASFTLKLATRAWAAKDAALQRMPATRALYHWLEQKLRSLL